MSAIQKLYTQLAKVRAQSHVSELDYEFIYKSRDLSFIKLLIDMGRIRKSDVADHSAHYGNLQALAWAFDQDIELNLNEYIQFCTEEKKAIVQLICQRVTFNDEHFDMAIKYDRVLLIFEMIAKRQALSEENTEWIQQLITKAIQADACNFLKKLKDTEFFENFAMLTLTGQ